MSHGRSALGTTPATQQPPTPRIWTAGLQAQERECGDSRKERPKNIMENTSVIYTVHFLSYLCIEARVSVHEYKREIKVKAKKNAQYFRCKDFQNSFPLGTSLVTQS